MQGESVPFGNLHKAVRGWRERWGDRRRGAAKQALGRLHRGPGCDPVLSPDADRNVLSHPSILLVILLNVSLNTLPTLALRVIYQALEKPRPKVRAGVPIAHSRDPTRQSLCPEQTLPDMRGRGWWEWRPRCMARALRGTK